MRNELFVVKGYRGQKWRAFTSISSASAGSSTTSGWSADISISIIEHREIATKVILRGKWHRAEKIKLRLRKSNVETVAENRLFILCSIFDSLPPQTSTVAKPRGAAIWKMLFDILPQIRTMRTQTDGGNDQWALWFDKQAPQDDDANSVVSFCSDFFVSLAEVFGMFQRLIHTYFLKSNVHGTKMDSWLKTQHHRPH